MSLTPKVVLFDVMDTLVRDPFRDEIPRFFGMSLRELIAQKHPNAWIHFELGEWDEDRFLPSFFADGRAFDHDAFREAIFGGYRFLPGIEELLVELRERGVEMHTASNYPDWWRAIEERTGLSRYVEWSFVSTRLGLRKPDAEFFEAMTNALGREPEQCLFVDDQPRNIDAARALGFDALLFEDAMTLRRELEARGLVSETRSDA